MIDKKTPPNHPSKFSLKLLNPKYILGWIGVALLYLVSLMPFRMQMAIGRAIGRFLYILGPKRKEIARVNLEMCFPEKNQHEIEEILKENLINTGVGIIEMGIAWWSSDRKIDELTIHYKNKEILESNEGILVLAKHTTHVEIDVRLMSRGLNMGGMYRPQKNKIINHIMINARNKYIEGAFHHKQASQTLDYVRNGKKMIYAADQDFGSKYSIFVPFFKEMASTITIPHGISQERFKVVFIKINRKKNGYEVEAKEIEPKEDQLEFLTNMNKAYTDSIIESPEQFLWVHRRFKTRPDGGDVYPIWKSREKRRQNERKSS